MSKSLERVKSILIEARIDLEMIETGTPTTTLVAAEKLGCVVDQITKSIIFKAVKLGAISFQTADAQRVCLDHAASLASQTSVKVQATDIRATTEFLIGGVSPLGQLTPITSFFDALLPQSPIIYAAVGTPIHVYGFSPTMM